jgi:hypothetical protein
MSGGCSCNEGGTRHVLRTHSVQSMRVSSRECVDRTDHSVVIIGTPAADTTERGLS